MVALTSISPAFFPSHLSGLLSSPSPPSLTTVTLFSTSQGKTDLPWAFPPSGLHIALVLSFHPSGRKGRWNLSLNNIPSWQGASPRPLLGAPLQSPQPHLASQDSLPFSCPSWDQASGRSRGKSLPVPLGPSNTLSVTSPKDPFRSSLSVASFLDRIFLAVSPLPCTSSPTFFLSSSRMFSPCIASWPRGFNSLLYTTPPPAPLLGAPSLVAAAASQPWLHHPVDDYHLTAPKSGSLQEQLSLWALDISLWCPINLLIQSVTH